MSLSNENASNWVCLLVTLQKLITDTFRSLIVAILVLGEARSQDSVLLLEAETDNLSIYSNLLLICYLNLLYNVAYC